ncbi:hypothetical protein HanOQP8_Chr04g0134931 [Helianthus annuus]|nr:hypothetical protein HanOQP8_Chr04g0134931 [Helianthus annuus]
MIIGVRDTMIPECRSATTGFLTHVLNRMSRCDSILILHPLVMFDAPILEISVAIIFFLARFHPILFFRFTCSLSNEYFRSIITSKPYLFPLIYHYLWRSEAHTSSGFFLSSFLHLLLLIYTIIICLICFNFESV